MPESKYLINGWAVSVMAVFFFVETSLERDSSLIKKRTGRKMKKDNSFWEKLGFLGELVWPLQDACAGNCRDRRGIRRYC